MSERLARKILLVGWDSAEWNVIRPLMNQGKLPHLTRLVDEGICGTLRSLYPHHSPALWTSLAAGKRPQKTGVCGYVEVCPDALDVRPITSYARTTKALWNIVSQAGLKVHCVNWYGSDPAEPVNGVFVSRGFFPPQGSAGTDRLGAPLFRGRLVHPPQLENELSQLQIAPDELNPANVLELLQSGTKIGALKHPRLQICTEAIAEAASVHATACDILQKHPFDLMAVLYTSLERFSHLLMPFHPPRQSHISELDFAMYQHAMTVGYQLHDMMLGRLIELAGDETTIIVVSDHGFKTGMARCDRVPATSTEAAIASHDSHGILVMRGPHILRDDTIEGATILDIAPTILTLLGVPNAADMDGRPLLGALDTQVTPEFIPSWDRVKLDAWDRPAEPAMQVDDRLRYLTDLGYVETPTAEARQRINSSRRENSFNLARFLIDAGENSRAIPILESLSKLFPYRPDVNKALFEAYVAVDRPDEARSIVQRFWDSGERGPLVCLGFALVSLAKRFPREALDHLAQISNSELIIPGLHILIGQSYLRLREWDRAEQAFNTELSLNPNNEQAWGGLAAAAIGKQNYQFAAEHALHAVGLKPDYAQAHYHLGLALSSLGRHENAAQAFTRCLEIDPDFVAAYRGLIRLYEGPLWNPVKARTYRELSDDCMMRRHLHRSPARPVFTEPAVASSMSCE
jgi:tetratricopeptide (TPR) repeat protein